MTAPRAFLLALLASVAMSCGDPLGPCPEGGEDCPLPDFTGDWEVVLTPPVLAEGSCQFGPIELRLEKIGVQQGREALAFQGYGGEHSAIEGTCDDAGWAALGMDGPGLLLSSGALDGNIFWVLVCNDADGSLFGCTDVGRRNRLRISLTLEGNCSDHPLCDGSGRATLATEFDRGWPNDGTLGGIEPSLRSEFLFLTFGENWTATRKGG